MPGTTLIKPQASSSQQSPAPSGTKKKSKGVSYSKWGYFFIAPFFLAFAVFSLIPLVSTFYNSFFENYWVGLTQVGPQFVGLQNYRTLFSDGDLSAYAGNTAIIWSMGFLPQIVFALLLASWFTDLRLHLRAAGFFKTVIYLPNLIMAAAFSMLFFTLFSDSGPVNSILLSMGMESPYRFLSSVWGTRGLIALMNFLMWYGNTTILLMAAILGIDTSLFEAAEIDGATAFKSFQKITLPLIRPILVYVLVTSLIGGIQMFDVPQILTNGNGNPNRTSLTLVMYLNKHLFSENVGMAGAVSVVLFVVSAVLSVIVFFSIREKKQPKGENGG
ncbi:carbohydrate ABC transporter permease [Faecalispora anaeroviscerum]|uniref:carbohydrate ABC transporter permease n=1 Tax=Faecalispora anaeroviscerum TaxID=2991836 RepID=UPI0024BA76E8|nr:sugar ABC transporter permease [Faecalispora anaeroviscerum]